jgi:UDP-N-acetylglucosamine--N-acetylmuramyl-(pentapeptide) pyrophosphoryl-undecaprenol N-acetylglucosamine transferase
VVISAGGFVALPVNWAAFILGRKVIIHQLDVKPTLTNKLSVWTAKLITTSFESSLNHFPKNKTKHIGTPIRQEIFLGDKNLAFEVFGLEKDLPTVLIVGGGTGALHLNQLVVQSVDLLVQFCQVIHVTGGGKNQQSVSHPRYHAFDFLTDKLKDAYAVSDLVVTRAGFGFLSELAVLGKAILIIPMPGTHQEQNVVPFVKNNAALKLDQLSLDAKSFSSAIEELLKDEDLRKHMSDNIKKIMPVDATEKFVDLLYGE